jgi:Flp pilus assembly protein TadG
MVKAANMERSGKARSFLSRLKRDAAGNTLALTAAAMVPLIGLVGSAVDLGRVYATRTRLQHACDASVLAGRKAMVGEVWSNESESLAKQFFASNFDDAKYGTSSSTITFTANKSKLSALATVTVPMSLMAVFGFNKNDVEASCTADLNLPNTDIMFVLDTTGSMELVNPGDSESRIVTMRKSVRSFYDSIEAAKSSGTNLRYGFVPYSQTVNVGAMLKPEWIADKWTYQSREPDGVDTGTIKGSLGTTSTTDNWSLVSGSYAESATVLPLEKCQNGPYTLDTKYTELSRTDTPYAGPPAGTETIRWVQAVQNGDEHWLEQSPVVCKLWKRTYSNYTTKWRERTIPNMGSDYTYTNYLWKYKPVTYDVSTLTVGGSIATKTGFQHSNRDIPWNGCIEERETTKKASYTPIPLNAYDMQIDLVPDGNAKTQWGPWLPALVWSRSAIDSWYDPDFTSIYDTQNYADYMSGAYAICPSPSRKLSAISSAELTTYLDSLVPSGKTYHDIGLVWGARLVSPTGLFSAENAGDRTRHLIFMTDGDTDTSPNDYDAYGISALDRRRAADKTKVPSKADSDAEVEMRFAALCEATKNKNITLWVIAFGTTLTPLLSDCANPGKAFEAKNAADLNKAFASIASQITQLRLVD